MRFLRYLWCVLAWSALSAAPSFAATYSWPVVIVQPVTITNVSVPQGGSVVVNCQGPPSPGADVNVIGSATVPVTASQGGTFSYSGSVSISVSPTVAFGVPGSPALGAPPPVSGGVVTCGLYLQVNGAQTLLGKPVTKSMP
jgi:hypothetical protein